MVHETLPRERERPSSPGERALGLPQSTALIVGSIIGVGIFNLPYSLAAYGPISLVAMALTTVGAVALALMFAALSRRLPADGGPYAYARAAFGNGVGFANAWSYWITAWAGNAAIVVGWVFYVEHFVNKDSAPAGPIVIALVGLWIPAAVNLTGVRNMGAFQVVDHGPEVHPLALMSTVGLFFISTGNFTPWNTSGDTNLSAIGGAMAICLFSYLGVETAAVAAAKVRNPERNVPRSTICGTLASAVVYLLSLIAVFGILPASALAQDDNKASYSVGGQPDRRRRHLGRLPRRGRRDHLRHRRAQRLDDDLRRDAAGRRQGRPVPRQRSAGCPSRRVPAFGIVVLHRAGLGRRVISYLGASGATVFTTLVLMTGITAAIPTPFSALAQLKWRWTDHQQRALRPRLVRTSPSPSSRWCFSVAVHLVLAQHRRHLVRRVGTVPDGRRRCAPRHPGLPRRNATHMTRGARGAT